jgi:hypothetical protein
MWLVSKLQASSSAPNCLAVVIPSLTMLLADSAIREKFDDHGGAGEYGSTWYPLT